MDSDSEYGGISGEGGAAKSTAEAQQTRGRKTKDTTQKDCIYLFIYIYIYIYIVRNILFAFGDKSPSHPGTVNLLECYLDEFLLNILLRASHESVCKGEPKLQMKHILRIIQEDKKKYFRGSRQLQMKKQIKEVKAKSGYLANNPNDFEVLKQYIDEGENVLGGVEAGVEGGELREGKRKKLEAEGKEL